MRDLATYEKTRDILLERFSQLGEYSVSLTRDTSSVKQDREQLDAASKLKREGKYDEACEELISIVDRHKVLDMETLFELYEVAACACSIDLALLLLSSTLMVYIDNDSLENEEPLEESAPYTQMKKLELCIGFLIKRSDENPLKELLVEFSGNPEYELLVENEVIISQLDDMENDVSYPKLIRKFLKTTKKQYGFFYKYSEKSKKKREQRQKEREQKEAAALTSGE